MFLPVQGYYRGPQLPRLSVGSRHVRGPPIVKIARIIDLMRMMEPEDRNEEREIRSHGAEEDIE